MKPARHGGEGLELSPFSSTIASLKAADNTPEQKRKAGLAACAAAADIDEAREFLAMLGLLEEL